MRKPPFDITQHPEYKRRQLERQIARQRQTEQDAEIGEHAFQAFRKNNGRLTRKDREALAKNLYWVVEEYYSAHADEERYVLLKDAGLTDENSTKVLPRLVLRPGDPGKANDVLYASTEKYRLLIEALTRRSGESLGGLASRVLAGTSFYPQFPNSHTPDMSEAHLILAALQVAVNRVDDEFQLLMQCRVVDQIRQQREAPYWQHLRETNELPDDASWQEGEEALWWPFADGWLPTGCYWKHDDGQDYFHYPIHSFWMGPEDFHSIQCLCDVDFFYFPHVYLGPAENWAGIRDQGVSDWIQEHLPNALEPRVCWEESTQRYVLRQSENSLSDEALLTEFEHDELMLEAARWLVMYPDPRLQKLVPAIFTLGTVCRGTLSPLTSLMVADFGDTNRWEYLGKDAPTLLHRLKYLTGFQTGEFKVYDAWRETAARFHWNPILRKHPDVIQQIRYRSLLEHWISKGRVLAHEEGTDD
ncbi:MAG: hypothetical protein ACOZB0_06360 [Pseudomonadota bacterium]